jgi:hypothetical protein
MFQGLLNCAYATTTPELIAEQIQDLSDGVVETIVAILPAIFTVVVVVVSLLIGYRLFRRMVGR